MVIEKLQIDFFNQIPALRYRMLYMRKVLKGVTPNFGIEMKADNGRQRKRSNVPSIATKARASVKTLRDQTFQVNGPQLFNSISVQLGKITKCPIEDIRQC